MKSINIKYGIAISCIFSLAILINGCKEVGPPINYSNGNTVLQDTTYSESPVSAVQAKNVLMEEYTGISCVNCPAAHVEVDRLIDVSALTPNKLIPVTFHDGVTLDQPQPHSVQSFVTQAARTLATNFGGLQGVPVGAIDRIYQASVPGIYDYSQNWSGEVSTEASRPSPVKMNLTNTYDAASKTMTITVELHYTSTQTDSNKLSIYLTEDSIVDAQEFTTGEQRYYVHNHIFRDAVTDVLGDHINTPDFVAGRVVRKKYQYTVSAAHSIWRLNKMHVVAFVHKYQSASAYDVLQTQTVNVIP